MDDLLLILILDRMTGGRDPNIRALMFVVSFFIVVGGFFAHPILGIFLLLIWGAILVAYSITHTGWKIIGWCIALLIWTIVIAAILMRFDPGKGDNPGHPLVGIVWAVVPALIYGFQRWHQRTRVTVPGSEPSAARQRGPHT